MSSHIFENKLQENEMKDSLGFGNASDNEKLYSTVYCRFTKTVLVEGQEFSSPLLESHCDIGIMISDNKECDSMSLITEIKERKNVLIGMSYDLHSIGLETMLMTMRKGETSHFHVRWTWVSDSDKRLEAEMGTIDQIEEEQYIYIVLYSFTEAMPIWKLSAEEKYELSQSHKDKGTIFFQEDKTEAAFYQYSLALKYLISILTYPKLPEAQTEKYKKLKCVCYFNMAACQIKYKNFESVIENCTKGLALEAWNIKGLYRRALAYKNTGKIDQARSDLIKIVKKEPKNKVASDLLESLMPSNIDNSPA